MSKRLLILTSILFFMNVALGTFLWFERINVQKRMQKIEDPVVEFGTTGVVKEEESDVEQKIADQSSFLYNRLPVQTDSFEISFNFQQDVFSVLIYEPYVESKEKFSQWIKDNELDAIPKDYFEFHFK